jgi:hypothetical protein
MFTLSTRLFTHSILTHVMILRHSWIKVSLQNLP